MAALPSSAERCPRRLRTSERPLRGGQRDSELDWGQGWRARSERAQGAAERACAGPGGRHEGAVAVALEQSGLCGGWGAGKKGEPWNQPGTATGPAG